MENKEKVQRQLADFKKAEYLIAKSSQKCAKITPSWCNINEYSFYIKKKMMTEKEDLKVYYWVCHPT